MDRRVEKAGQGRESSSGKDGGALPSPIRPFISPEVESGVLSLHAATDAPGLWRGLQRLMRAALPFQRITLFLGHLGMSAARQVFTDPPLENSEVWFSERGRLSPFANFIDMNRGVRMYRFSDVLDLRTWEGGVFFRRFAQAEGWCHGVTVLFWSQKEVTAMFSLYRTADCGDFSDADLAVLTGLYAHVEVALERVRSILGERISRAGLEEFNRTLPIGLLLLDWDLKLLFANQTAFEQCALWNLGPDAARQVKARASFELPAGLRVFCEEEKARFIIEGHGAGSARRDQSIASAPASLSVRLSLLARSSEAAARPRFLVVIESSRSLAAPAEPGASIPGDASNLRHLRLLTPREREVVDLVCEGRSNADIARALGKSELTIKTQLSAVYSKTGVRSRARLMALLRGRA